LTVDVPPGLPTEIRLPFPATDVEVVRGEANVTDASDARITFRAATPRTFLRVR
jgi:hypothetical protein